MSLSVSGLRFRPSVIPTLAAAAALVLMIYLGTWQQGRAAEKDALQAEFDARASRPAVTLTGASTSPDLRYRHAVASGAWQRAGEIYLDNKVNDGVAGFDVITPLRLSGEKVHVLVNRGWIPRGPAYPAPPALPPLPETASVRGILTFPPTRFVELSADAVQGRVWQNLTIARYRAASGLEVLPYMLLADHAESPLKAVAEHPSAGADKHREYMLTWYSLAATIVVLWVCLNIERVAGNGGAERSSARGDTK